MHPFHGDGRGAAWLARRQGRRPKNRKAIKSDKQQNGRILRVGVELRRYTLHKKVLDETGTDSKIPTVVHTAAVS
jgi:hypothetical protein